MLVRRSLVLVVGAAFAAAPIALHVSAAPGAAADGGHSPAAAIVAAHVPAGGGGAGGGDVAVLDAGTLATLTVTTTADDGSVGSLRQVVQAQATTGGGDSVVLAAGMTYVLTCAQGGDLDHGNTPLELVGNGATITMESSCEEGILDNGTGALVIRDVDFTGLDLTPTSALAAIVETGGPFTLIGGRVTDNRVDSGVHALNGFFFKSSAAPGTVVVEGTVFARNSRDTGSDCGLFCVVGDVELHGVQISDTTVLDTQSGCGGILCVSGDVELLDSTVTATANTGTSHCGGIACLAGDLTVTRTAIAGTSSTQTGTGGVCGGILCSNGALTMTDSSVTGTSAADLAAEDCGGGFACADGPVSLLRSTVSGSRVVLTPGGGDNDCGSMVCADGALSVVNSTVADNTTTGGGLMPASFAAGGPVELVYATFVGNSGSGLPALGPFDVESVDVTVFGSVLAASGAGGTCGPDLSVVSQGYSFADETSCDLVGPGDRQAAGANPGLGALADHGGPGPTMLPGTGSPLVDGVAAAACQSDGAAAITTDERSLPRPSTISPSCDIGAVEVQSVPVLEPSFTG